VACGWAVELARRAAGHDDDHGPADVGFVVGGQPLVVPDRSAVAGDPRQRHPDDGRQRAHRHLRSADTGGLAQTDKFGHDVTATGQAVWAEVAWLG